MHVTLTQPLPLSSAKELEHYQRVRATFEGPAKPKSLPAATTPEQTSLPSRPHSALGPGANSHLHPPPMAPIPKKRLKPVRSNTAKKDDVKGKGKGKATKWDSDTDDDDDDEAYVTSNDSVGWTMTPDRRIIDNGNSSFGNGAVDGDEELYQ